jgi:hypothetical protein
VLNDVHEALPGALVRVGAAVEDEAPIHMSHFIQPGLEYFRVLEFPEWTVRMCIISLNFPSDCSRSGWRKVSGLRASQERLYPSFVGRVSPHEEIKKIEIDDEKVTS